MELVTEEKKGLKRTEVGLIPEDWEVLSIPELTRAKNGIKIGPFGSQLKKDLLFSSGYKVYGQENVFEQDTNVGNRYISKEHFIRLKSCELLPGDFIISMMGTIGKCMIIPEGIEPGIMDSHLLRLRLNNEKMLPELLIHFFGSKIILHQINSLTVGGIMDGLSSSIVKKIQIPLPPTLSEQQAIASALSDMDELIRSLDGLIQKKQAIKKGTMQQLLTGKKRLPRFDGEWEVKKLGDLAENISSGKSNTKSNVGNYPIYGSTGIIGHSSSFDYRGDKILVARVGANAGTVNQVNGEYNVSDNTLMVNLKSIVNIDFVRYFLVEYDLGTLIFGSGQPLITGGQLKKLDIRIPDLEYQNKIVEILSDMDQELQTLRQKREKYLQIKQGMMQELLTGRIRIYGMGG